MSALAAETRAAAVRVLQQAAETRAAAVRVLQQAGATDLIPVLGLDQPRRGRPSQYGDCRTDGCTRSARTKGMCQTCYVMAWRAEQRAAGRVVTHGPNGYNLGCRCATCRDGRHRRARAAR